MKQTTPLQQYIDKLEATSRWANSDDQRQFFKLAADNARALLHEERRHIEIAWNDGQSGVKHQSGAQYYGATYDGSAKPHSSTADLDMADKHGFKPN